MLVYLQKYIFLYILSGGLVQLKEKNKAELCSTHELIFMLLVKHCSIIGVMLEMWLPVELQASTI